MWCLTLSCLIRTLCLHTILVRELTATLKAAMPSLVSLLFGLFYSLVISTWRFVSHGATVRDFQDNHPCVTQGAWIIQCVHDVCCEMVPLKLYSALVLIWGGSEQRTPCRRTTGQGIGREEMPSKTTGEEGPHCSQGCLSTFKSWHRSYPGKDTVLGDMSSSPRSASDLPCELKKV